MEIAAHIATVPYTGSRPVFVKKNAPPDPVQSSVDSLVTMEPSGSTSTSDLWPSPGSDTSSYTDQPSPEQAHMRKRNSVFNLRNRSNTSNSTSTSSMAATSPSMPGHDNVSHRLSQDLRHLAGQSIVEINSAKRSLFRGKKSKRTSGSFSPSSPPYDAGDADATFRRTSVLRKPKRPSLPSESTAHESRPRISSPFDFKHLTHTDRHQFASLTGASENELVAGFHNLSASQPPRRGLTGIKADDLRARNLSAEGLMSTGGANQISPMSLKSPMSLRSPVEEEKTLDPPLDPSSRPQLRTARSVESFSRPGVNPRMHRHTQSANANANAPPPPRTSSRLAMAPMHDLPEESTEIPPLPPGSRRNSGVWNHLSPMGPQSPTGGLLPSMMEATDYVGHALTTPDNSAIHPITPPFSPGLDDVAEEPERFSSPRPAPLPPVRAPASPIRTSLESFSFSNPRSPTYKSHTRKVSFTSPKAPNPRPTPPRPLSQCSDTLGSPSGTRRRSSGRRVSVRRKSNTWRVMEESWEDDIDYIYDNALEADCDLEWDRASITDGTGDETSRDGTPERKRISDPAFSSSHSTQTSSLRSRSSPPNHDAHQPSGAPRPSLFVPQASLVPELEMRSAVSASTIDTTGVHTPSDLFPDALSASSSSQHYALHEAEGFSLTPSLLIPHEYKDAAAPPHDHDEEDYADLIADYAASSDRHFPLLEATRSIASSTRSSHFRSSKRSSYDSSLMSSGLASGSGSQTSSWTAPGVRRSASSAGSLPELVHSSRNVRRDFNAVVDRLSQQIALFNAFEEDGSGKVRDDRDDDDDEEENDDDDDDDEITPPIHGSRDRTFFTSDDEGEDQQRGGRRGSVEADVKNSLELAQRGPSRTTASSPYHKHASSDGAAKMLMTSSNHHHPSGAALSRHRAASTANATRKHREQYIALFPTPPAA